MHLDDIRKAHSFDRVVPEGAELPVFVHQSDLFTHYSECTYGSRFEVLGLVPCYRGYQITLKSNVTFFSLGNNGGVQVILVCRRPLPDVGKWQQIAYQRLDVSQFKQLALTRK
jgi:hypothetical protein